MSQKGELPKLPYKDIPSVAETYVDGVGPMLFNGRTANFIFTVNRYDEPKPPRPPSGSAVTAARIVFDVPSAVDLFNKLQQLVGLMAQQGLVELDGQKAKTTVQ